MRVHNRHPAEHQICQNVHLVSPSKQTHFCLIFPLQSQRSKTQGFKSANRVRLREHTFKYKKLMWRRVAVSPLDKVSHLQQ